MDCDDAVSVTVGTGLVGVSGVDGVGEVLLLLLTPLPHAPRKSTTPATAVTSNIEGFCRAMGRLAGLVLLEQYRPNDHSVPLATTPGSGRIYKKQFFRPELAQAEAEYCLRGNSRSTLEIRGPRHTPPRAPLAIAVLPIRLGAPPLRRAHELRVVGQSSESGLGGC